MGALQPGLPSPVAVPEGYNIIIIDLQDCFFTIPLSAEDKKQFAFSLPSENFKQPYLRFQWKVLPQGMKNSPTLCQKFVNAALEHVRAKYEQVYMMAPHSSTLAWKIPWTEEPGRLQSMRSLRVRHD